MPDGSGVMMLHQRGVSDDVQPVVGGYGRGPQDACNGIVHPAVTMVSSDGSIHSGPAMVGMVLAVDMAISSDGKRVAVVSAGNATNSFVGGPTGGPALTQVFVSDTTSVTDGDVGCQPDGTHSPCSPGQRRDAETHGTCGSGSSGSGRRRGGGVPEPVGSAGCWTADRGRLRGERQGRGAVA